jgi:DNA-binding transcriptional ArsR family regulator
VPDHTAQLAALGDPTRRQIIEILLAGSSSVIDIAEQMPVSRPAVSQHLRLLKDAGLVVVRADGTRNVYQIDPGALKLLRDHFESMWQSALDQFKTAAERKSPRRKEKRK